MPTETESIPPLWPWCLRAPLATNNLGVSLSRESLSADPNGTQIHGGGQVRGQVGSGQVGSGQAGDNIHANRRRLPAPSGRVLVAVVPNLRPVTGGADGCLRRCLYVGEERGV